MFSILKKKVADRLALLSNHQLLRVELERNTLFDAYLNCFIDPVERQSHNCNCCKNFIRNYGGVIAIVDGKVETVWDFEMSDIIYDRVPVDLGKIVREAPIKGIFLSESASIGTDHNFQTTSNGTIKWEHFHAVLPSVFVVGKHQSIATIAGVSTATKQVFKRALDEIDLDSIDTVLELIQQGSLYRGEEHKSAVEAFRKYKVAYQKLTTDREKELYIWSNAKLGGRIRNTVIGTLLVDLAEGKDLDYAVKSFEQKVAPANYKRPTALVTKGMIEQAEKTINELGLTQSLARRYAVTTDIPINDVLFVNRDSLTPQLTILESMKAEVVVNPRTFSKVEEVSIDTFIKEILPTAISLELLVENKHNNFMSLVATVHEDAPLLFNWDNGISWSYQDGLADSVKGRVKAAGGSVEGELRISLEWFNYDDLDLHVVEPNGNRIYFSNKLSRTSGGFLDVDMNAGGGGVGNTREAVENVIFKNKMLMLEGIYKVQVNNFCKRENIATGFGIEIECQDKVFTFGQSAAVPSGHTVEVCEFSYTKADGITYITNSTGERVPTTKEVWGLNTNTFHKVSMMLLSPNHWGNKQYGNKHTFFILDKAVNPKRPRGIFNEFLKPELQAHRKVFEVLGSKLRVEDSDQQLSGLGFSSTQRAEVFVRVTGKFTRVIKVKF